MKDTFKATLAIVVVALASVATVALHAQGGEENQDVYVAVYKKATEAQDAPAASRPVLYGTR
jgi:hypothetical protein